ncbi:hypothetical protein TIFTF001_029675 [Ficus carica]|uniref:Uncharacterized protein n=1 Tax=Ficus carica TaxID=3494 RepID=A0AA88DRX1_FICCA|nr:hypothetical protein TIFTF001_029675 [Ficus carica]
MCSARESKREREIYQFHGRVCGWRGNGVGGGGWVWRSHGVDWTRERKEEARERMNGGVVAGGDWRREKEGEG